MAITKFVCLDCLNKLQEGKNNELVCTFCKQKFIFVLQLVRIDSYKPSSYIEPKEDDPYP